MTPAPLEDRIRSCRFNLARDQERLAEHEAALASVPDDMNAKGNVAAYRDRVARATAELAAFGQNDGATPLVSVGAEAAAPIPPLATMSTAVIDPPSPAAALEDEVEAIAHRIFCAEHAVEIQSERSVFDIIAQIGAEEATAHAAIPAGKASEADAIDAIVARINAA